MKTFKKILASLMVAVMVLTAAPLSGFVGMKLNLDWLDFTPKASAAENTVQQDIKGDLNGDGMRNSSDVLRVLQYVVGKVELTDEQLLQADANEDGFVNSTDALLILRFS